MMEFLQWLGLLFFFLISPINSLSALPPSHFPSHLPLCHPHEISAFLHFKNSLSVFNDTSYCADYLGITNPNSTVSWDMSRDCCTWSGVTCDEVSSLVVRLDLGCSGLQGIIHSNSSLFLLTHLQTLVLSYNFFYGSKISPQFSRFMNMIHLGLSDSGFTGQLPLEFSFLSSLVTLDLSRNYDLTLETFSLKCIVANLTSFKELNLFGVNMSFVSPNSFKNLSTSLKSLDLRFSGLQGEFPENIFHLPNLQTLDLSYNRNLNGSFPHYNWTSQLKNLNLSGTGFLIDLPYISKTLKSLNSLFLRSCNFKGSYLALLGNSTQIPWSSLLNLEKLTSLDLSNNNFIGQLPHICNNSTKITFLCDFPKHQLLGSIPLKLKALSLSNNLLNGTIPIWLYSLPQLQDLDLSRNQFTGHIDEFQYASLVTLSLESNKLQGFIPRSIFQQVHLYSLDLSSNNLSGVLQFDQSSKLKNLQYIDLSFRSISRDSINSIISALPNTLRSLSLSSCNISEFPHSLRRFEKLGWLDLSNNQIEGIVPQWFWKVGKDSLGYLNISHNLLTHMEQIPWKELELIDLSSNRLQGHLPIPPPSTALFSISNNQFVGEISPLFCNLRQIEVLALSNNSLSGNIPACLGNSSNSFSVLDLRMNRFHGVISLAFSTLYSLRTLNLNRNQLEGPLPQSLVNCEKLEVLDVGNNKLNGSFPFWLESLPELHVLILRANRFSGPISDPKVRFPFQKLRIIDLSDNEFTGLLPTEYFRNFAAMMDARADSLVYMNYTTQLMFYYEDSVVVAVKGFYVELVKIQTLFITIDCSKNYFTGEILELIGKLNSLKGLNLSYNKLTGLIPPLLGNLSNLEWLDLSSNKLSGKIPLQLEAGLNQLGFLNLSNNELTGPIPRGKQFDTFNNDSYNGNMGLCGFPLSKPCSNHEAQQAEGNDHDGEDENGMIDRKVVMMGYASGLVIGISIGYMVLYSRSCDYWFLKRFGGGRRRRTSTRSRGRRRPN